MAIGKWKRENVNDTYLDSNWLKKKKNKTKNEKLHKLLSAELNLCKQALQTRNFFLSQFEKKK